MSHYILKVFIISYFDIATITILSIFLKGRSMHIVRIVNGILVCLFVFVCVFFFFFFFLCVKKKAL